MLAARTLVTRAPGIMSALAVGALVLAAAVLVLLPLPYNVAAVVGIGTAVLTLLRPTWGLYLVLLSVPVQDLGAPRLGDTAITATKVMVPLALIAWLALRLSRGGMRLAPAALIAGYGLYVAALAASIMTAISQPAAITETLRWVQAFGIFLMTLDLIRTRRALAGLAAVLILGGLSQAVLGLVQSGMGAGPASFAIGAGLSRAYGTFGMPNSYGGYLEMTFPLALALGVWLTGRLLPRRPAERFAVRSSQFTVINEAEQRSAERVTVPPRRSGFQTRPYRQLRTANCELRTGNCEPAGKHWLAWLVVGGAAALLLAGLAASYSRGAWLGTAVGVAAMIALAGRRSFVAGAIAALVLAAVLWLGGTAVLPGAVSGRLDSIGESLVYRDVRRMVITPGNFALAERFGMWEAGLAMFRAEPVTGVGAGNFNVVYHLYRVPQFLYSRGHAHNYYIHIAAETGIIGLAAYALVLLTGWVDIGRALRRVRRGWPRALVVGAGGVLTAVMVHNIGENLHVLNMNLHLFAILAIPSLALRLTDAERPPS